MNAGAATLKADESIKARLKTTWESGDFGEIAKYNEPAAAEFLARAPLKRGQHVLDVACGTGNLAVLAAEKGCEVSGIDIASNLIRQAKARAAAAGLSIDYREGDAEALPYSEGSFDVVLSMFGVMFAPNHQAAASELLRVAKPGGVIALANWTPEGFIGKMFAVFSRHIPPPAGGASPLQWGVEKTVRELLAKARRLTFTRRIARLRYPYDVPGTIEFFRAYYGPTHRAFASLSPAGQVELRKDLEALQREWNVSDSPAATEVHAEYAEVVAER